MLNFDTTAEIYLNAYTLACCSQLAYLDGKFDVANMFDKCIFWKTIDGYAAKTADNLVLCFRGTQNIADMISDVNAIQVKGYGGLAHYGFTVKLNNGLAEIIKSVQDLANGVKFLWITGHSMGGALATLASIKMTEWLANNKTEIGYMRVFTFGSPRVLDTAAALAYTPEQYRFVNYNDPITKVPNFALKSYKHVGQEYRLPRTYTRPVFEFWCWLKRMLAKADIQADINAHHIETYLEHLDLACIKLPLS